MCRLLGFRSNAPLPLAYPLLAAPNALVKQSKKDSRGLDHPDGWGIGYYQNWLRAHNGTVRPFDDIYQKFLKQNDAKFLALRQGQTDSEMCFLLFLTELAKFSPAGLNFPAPELAVEGLRRTV